VSEATGQQNSDIYEPLHDWITESGWRGKYFLSLTSGVMTVASHMTGPITGRLSLWLTGRDGMVLECMLLDDEGLNLGE